MSYESKMLKAYEMPSRREVEEVLLKTMFKHNGVIREFRIGEEIVDEIADDFGLTSKQREAQLETLYRKENRLKKSYLWHRLLFRAANSLANEECISRPTETVKLTKKKEWMLSEKGFTKAMRILNIPSINRNFLPIKSIEVQKTAKKMIETPRPINYIPFEKEKKVIRITRESSIRLRGFRQAVIEAYDYKCAVCGLKLYSPDSFQWEVEAAHIVPHSALGKDDIWNGLSLCHLHHWAFDVGWFTILDNYSIKVSSKSSILPEEFGRIGNYELLKEMTNNNSKIFLPYSKNIFPHYNSIRWHREKIFFQ